MLKGSRRDHDRALMAGDMENGSVCPVLLETLPKMDVWGEVNLILSTIINVAS